MQRFIPLGNTHVRDIVTRAERPVVQCRVSCIYPGKDIYVAKLEGVDAEILVRVDAKYAIFFANEDRLVGIVLGHYKEVEGVDYLTTVAQAIQLSADPIVFVECLPVDLT
jgi:hypothetical protein